MTMLASFGRLLGKLDSKVFSESLTPTLSVGFDIFLTISLSLFCGNSNFYGLASIILPLLPLPSLYGSSNY